MKPVIVDTSVWIDFFKGNETDQVGLLTEYIKKDHTVYLCPVILQELLQGIPKNKQFQQIRDYLLAFKILNDDPIEMAISAAELYRSLRKKGITIRKSNDCLIAQYAIKHSLKVLHRDRDFDLIFKSK